MRLSSRAGASLALRPVRDEFPSRKAEGPDDYDANWLVIRGEAEAADGRSWTFEDACLTTWDARALSAWLRGVSSGHVPVVGWTGDEEVLEAFIEPNLAFSLASREAGNLRLRVHLSLESLPPWLRGQIDLYEYFSELDVTLDDLAAAIASWDAELAEFPER